MSLRGDIGAVTRLAGAARGIPQRLPDIAASSAAGIRSIVAAQLAARQNPYGESWPEAREGSSGPSRDHVDVVASGNSVRAVLGHGQRKRQLVIPTEARGIPDAWRAELERNAERALAQAFDGVGEGGAGGGKGSVR